MMSFLELTDEVLSLTLQFLFSPPDRLSL